MTARRGQLARLAMAKPMAIRANTGDSMTGESLRHSDLPAVTTKKQNATLIKGPMGWNDNDAMKRPCASATMLRETPQNGQLIPKHCRKIHTFPSGFPPSSSPLSGEIPIVNARPSVAIKHTISNTSSIRPRFTRFTLPHWRCLRSRSKPTPPSR